MSNVFGARGRSPQFPQRRALKTRNSPFAKGGKVPGYFLGGLFGSTPGSSSSNSSSQTNFQVTDPNYNAMKDYVLSSGLDLIKNTPFQSYGSNPMVGLTPEQQQGIDSARNNVGNYQPFYNKADNTVGNVQGAFDPSRGQSFIDQAGNMQTGSGAASPFIQNGSQTFPSAMQEYMSPYTQQVIGGIQDASNRNFEQNTMRTINDTFTGGNAAQFGREQHGNAVGNAVFAKSQADNAAVANALESGYNTAGSLFNADQNRQLQAGQMSGSLAQGDMAQRAGLGQTAASVQGTNTGSGLGLAQSQVGLGQNTQNSGLADANSLLQAGAVDQTTRQNQSNFDYNEFQQKIQHPYQQLQFGQGLSQGWQLPTQSNTTSQSTSTMTQPQGSPFGQILGAGIGLGSLAVPGAGGASALGNIFGGIKGLFAADGGYVGDAYAQGGMVPTIGQMRKRNGGMGAMPTGMPGMPPMAPPMQQGPQPNGQMAYAKGGPVLDMCYDDGGYFLPASEGLDARNDERAEWESRRPSPFGPESYQDIGPTGRDKTLREDPLLYMWRSLPPHIRDALSFGREMMPDKVLGSAMNNSGQMSEAIFGGRPMDAVEAAGNTGLDLASIFAPGAMRGSRALMEPLARRMIGAR